MNPHATKLITLLTTSLLLVVNIAFGIIILKMQDRPQEVSAYELKTALILQAELTASALSAELDSLGISREAMESECTALFVPPYPCTACLDAQKEIFLEQAEKQQPRRFLVIAPESIRRDILAACVPHANLNTIFYNTDSTSNPIFSLVSGGVLFTAENGHPVDVFISNSIFPDISGDFLSSPNISY